MKLTPLSALAIINFIRMEKQPPLARYCTLLTLHLAPAPMTTHQLAKAMSCTGPQSGTIDSCLRQGLIQQVPGSTSSAHYALTTNGRNEVKRILTSAPATVHII